ncbi:MAG: hypothetical protein IKS65_07670, partial [Bacteroidales bacterium]|nr:hypothetical protein [Bacteroidales bacterium]
VFFFSLSPPPVSFFSLTSFIFLREQREQREHGVMTPSEREHFFLLREHGAGTREHEREQKISSLRLCDNSSLARCIICLNLVEMFTLCISLCETLKIPRCDAISRRKNFASHCVSLNYG